MSTEVRSALMRVIIWIMNIIIIIIILNNDVLVSSSLS